MTQDITPEQFEAGGFLKNYLIPITTLEKSSLSGCQIFTNQSARNTSFDMTMQGMHINEEILGYMKNYFLDFICTKQVINVTQFANSDGPLLTTNDDEQPDMYLWECPCTKTDIDGLPTLSLSLKG